jgi:hypothetical protein
MDFRGLMLERRGMARVLRGPRPVGVTASSLVRAVRGARVPGRPPWPLSD